MVDNDELRRALIKEFYELYRPLQKRNGLREHSHFDIYGNNYIEIWEYRGDKRTRCVCKVREDTEENCYTRAIEALKEYGNRERGLENEKRAG